MNRGISSSGKRIRIKAVKYYVIAGQLIKLKVVNYSRLRPDYRKQVSDCYQQSETESCCRQNT